MRRGEGEGHNKGYGSIGLCEARKFLSRPPKGVSPPILGRIASYLVLPWQLTPICCMYGEPYALMFDLGTMELSSTVDSLRSRAS